jgi:mxaJ protein
MTPRTLLVALVMMLWTAESGTGQRGPAPLRVCADPDNLPFSNARGDGFENRIVELAARDLGTHVAYTWWAQRRGFLRETLKAGACDVVVGLPARMEAAWTTQPYYRSSYVFVERAGRASAIRSFDDPRLRQARIAVPLVGDDGANAPPAHALARRGLIANLMPISVYDRTGPAPGARLVGAVARGEADVAAAWGPVAGFFAARERVALRVTPVEPQVDAPALPLAFDIAMATRRDDTVRHAALEAFLARRQREIDRVLEVFHVPRIDRPAGAAF